MIVASPRPVAAASEPAPLLRLRADEIQLDYLQLKMGCTPQSKMDIPVNRIAPGRENITTSHPLDSNLRFPRSEECQNGDPSTSASSLSLSSGDNWKELPPPKYTRHSTCLYPLPGHAPQPSTCSTSSTTTSSSASTARPSFESFTTPSDHSHLHQQRGEQKDQQMAQQATVATQIHRPSSAGFECVPSYDSSFTDTNLSGFADEALSALSLARENLADLERANFTEFDDLDRSDDRIDPDAIVQRRLTRNLLLTRQSAITFASASSVYSDGSAGVQHPPRDSLYSTYDFDPARVSVQTYGSSVLTYGSRASQLLDGENSSSSNGGNGADGSRPVAPLPWLPRPSALDRIQHCGIHLTTNGGRARSGSTGSNSTSGGSSTGRRPLPPLPTPVSASGSSGVLPIMTRDRSVSLPSRSTSSGSNYSVSSPSSAETGPVRRPRPLPRTPTSVASTTSYLPDIKEGETSESLPPSSGPVRSNSMFLSPISAAAPLNFSAKGRKSARYGTIGYGHVSRTGVRGMFLRNSASEEASAGGSRNLSAQRQVQAFGRAASRASTRSAQTTLLVPDVEELVRILDSMDDGSGSGSSSESTLATPVAGLWESRPSVATKKADDEGEEIGIAEALACSRSVVNVPCGAKHGAAATLEDLGVTKSIGLPTPAATPRSSPQRQPTSLPASSKTTTVKLPASPILTTQPQLEQAEDALSPTPSSATDVLSLTSFPMPPMAPLYIPAPSAVGASEMPIPSGEPSPSLVDVGKSPAEKAMLPGMSTEVSDLTSQANGTQQKHKNTRDAIADLKHRVSELPALFPIKKGIKKLPSGVPLLGLPVPPRHRAQPTTTNKRAQKKHLQPPAIDVRAANALAPPSSFNVGKSSGSNSAPANNLFFDFSKSTIIYETPAPAPATPVAPLKIRRTSNQTQTGSLADATKAYIPPAANTPQSASAAQTMFTTVTQPPSARRAQRATSFYVSPDSASSVVAPLRLRSTNGPRARSSTVGSAPALPHRKQEQVTPATLPVERTSSETDASEESENDQLVTPTAPHAPLANVVEHTSADEDHERRNGFSIMSNGSFAAVQQGTGAHVSLDPAFADMIKSMAGASEEEQMGSLLTIASSINTEHHASGYNAGFFLPIIDESHTRADDGFVDVNDDGNETVSDKKEMAQKSTASSVNACERRKSRTKSVSSIKKRYSTRSAAAVRAAIRALPDPNTFPIPDSGGSVATNSSAGAAAADYTGFGMRPSPLPKLRVVTKFKGGTVLLPTMQAPLSATSTKSTMSSLGGHSRNQSAVSVNLKRTSTTGGVRKMNRLTLTDPRSPMADATVKAAALVARVRQKRAALALRNRARAEEYARNERDTVIVVQRGHARTGSGSSGTLRSKLKMSGGGFFGGGSVRAIPSSDGSAASSVDCNVGSDVVLRSGPYAHRPTIRRLRMARTSVVLPKSGKLDLCA